MNATRSSVASRGQHSAVAPEFRLVPSRRSAYTPRGRTGLVAVAGARHLDTSASFTARAGHSVVAAVALMGLGR